MRRLTLEIYIDIQPWYPHYHIDISDHLYDVINSVFGDGDITHRTIERLLLEYHTEYEKLTNAIKNAVSADLPSMIGSAIDFEYDEMMGSDYGLINAMRDDIEAGRFATTMTNEDFLIRYKEENNIIGDDYDREDADYEYNYYLANEEYWTLFSSYDFYERARKIGVTVDYWLNPRLFFRVVGIE